MLRRAKRLSKPCDEYCDNIRTQKYKLSKAEWRQVDYLLYITEPFYRFTTVLSKTKEITVYHVFGIYNALFEHFEESIARLTPKTIPWKKAMLQALNAGMAKLTSYYTKTKEIHSSLYAIGTILAPQHKLHFFSSKAWGTSENDTNWSDQYKETLRQFIAPYAQRHTQTRSLREEQPPKRHSASTSDLDALLDLLPHIHSDPSTSEHELARYLEKRTLYSLLLRAGILIPMIARRKVDPLQFWKEYENEFPILSSVARDILSIPATGAGVERLFNSARDVCHYRRGRLSAKTVQDIMMFRCKTQFDIEIEELPDEDTSLDSMQEADEQREAELTTDIPEPISDGEDSEDNDPVGLIEHEFIMESQLPRPSIVLSTRKRQRSELVDSEDESSPHLPHYGDKGSTQKRPGLREARKRGKPNDDQFVSY